MTDHPKHAEPMTPPPPDRKTASSLSLTDIGRRIALRPEGRGMIQAILYDFDADVVLHVDTDGTTAAIVRDVTLSLWFGPHSDSSITVPGSQSITPDRYTPSLNLMREVCRSFAP